MYNVYGNAYRELGSFSWARDPTQSKLHPHIQPSCPIPTTTAKTQVLNSKL